MKLSIATIVFAGSCPLLGCSSSPLAPLPESESGPGPAASAGASGTNVGVGAGAGAAPVSAPSAFTPYPKGPYGTSRGATIENLSFLGWKHPDLAGYDPNKFET